MGGNPPSLGNVGMSPLLLGLGLGLECSADRVERVAKVHMSMTNKEGTKHVTNNASLDFDNLKLGKQKVKEKMALNCFLKIK